MTAHAAPQLRRKALDAAGRVNDSVTRREREMATMELFAYVSSLEILVRSGIDAPGISPGVGIGVGDSVALDKTRQFIGSDNDADRLGFTTNLLGKAVE